ncbi:MAG: UDP-N-acetylmuramate--L-alanine ligase [Candidatus Omnitrophica bacterium]|nr:UDP-N-acetylmuramate--L-alanine ligase [Candidatus Omnitrophota bacterium]
MEKIHFIGIGGIGMSALADIALATGDVVSGSDLRGNNLTDKLAGKGAGIYEGHLASNLSNDVDLVVKSASIKDNNPEIVKAKELGIPVLMRSEMLKKVLDGIGFSVAVTGTHGKTTTSALVAHIFEYCGKDPTVIVGGEIDTLGGNSKFGNGDILVAEIDESDGYFRDISAKSAVITNVEREHMETYGTIENLIAAYEDFISKISPEGFLVFNGEDNNLRNMVKAAGTRTVSFGIGKDFDVTCCNATWASCIEFDLIIDGGLSGKVESSLIGRYNVMNILAAISACGEMGLNAREIIKAIKAYRGVKRRFESMGKTGGIEVIEDYAHHPTEIKAVINAAKNYVCGRLIAVFQPHKYSRTKDLMEEFSECFFGADILVLSDIYSADEDVIQGVVGEELYGRIDKTRFEKAVFLRKENIPDAMVDIVEENDLVLILGAGNIREIGPKILSKLSGNTPGGSPRIGDKRL